MSENIYYNINAANKSTDPVLFRFQDVRGESILHNANQYKLSILRFSIDTSQIPLMLFPATGYNTYSDINYSTPDNANWSITVHDLDANTFSQQYIIYQDKGRNSQPEIGNGIYSFDDFCDMLNDAIRRAQGALSVSTTRPVFLYDRDNKCINLYCPPIYNSNNLGGLNLYVNKPLYNLFCRDYQGTYLDGPNGKCFLFDVEAKNNAGSVTEVRSNGALVTSAYTGFMLKTYFQNLGGMTCLKAIAFTTLKIPVVNEYINQGSDLINLQNQGSIQILKDFEIDSSSALTTRGPQNYTVSSEFQMIDISTGSTTLRDVDISIYWRDNHSRLIPFYMSADSTFTMKTLFRKSF